MFFRQMLPSTKQQTTKHDIKHELWKTLSSVSLLKIVGEKLPPWQRSTLWEFFTYELQKWHWAKSFPHFVFYISVCPFVALSKATFAEKSHIRLVLFIFWTCVDLWSFIVRRYALVSIHFPCSFFCGFVTPLTSSLTTLRNDKSINQRIRPPTRRRGIHNEYKLRWSDIQVLWIYAISRLFPREGDWFMIYCDTFPPFRFPSTKLENQRGLINYCYQSNHQSWYATGWDRSRGSEIWLGRFCLGSVMCWSSNLIWVIFG